MAKIERLTVKCTDRCGAKWRRHLYFTSPEVMWEARAAFIDLGYEVETESHAEITHNVSEAVRATRILLGEPGEHA